jgi:hypothetical protein
MGHACLLAAERPSFKTAPGFLSTKRIDFEKVRSHGQRTPSQKALDPPVHERPTGTLAIRSESIHQNSSVKLLLIERGRQNFLSNLELSSQPMLFFRSAPARKTRPHFKGRYRLVASRELTLGRPFEEIVLNEHQRVHPEHARQLYLDIAIMHQFSVTVRAGTISRIFGIDFDDYRDQFFGPLPEIVRVEQDRYSGDFCYKTRHSRVATIVFRQVCTDDAGKAQQFKKVNRRTRRGLLVLSTRSKEITRGSHTCGQRC